MTDPISLEVQPMRTIGENLILAVQAVVDPLLIQG
jgi:hypothetical protein